MDAKNQALIRVANELVDTEITYVDKLSKLVLLFVKRANVYKSLDKEILSEQEINVIFMNIEEIYKLNNNMLNSLLQLRYKGEDEFVNGVCNILSKFAPFMKIYMRYLDNYEKALATIENIKRKPQCAEFIRVGELLCGDDFGSLLILPVQRIPRYILLMKELIKASKGQDRETIEYFEKNVKELETIADAINNNVKVSEARKKVVVIQKKLFKNKVNLIAAHRFVLALGKVEILDRSGLFNKRIKCLLILFNDIIIWAEEKKGGKGYKMKQAAPLERVSVTPLSDPKGLKAGEAAFNLRIEDETIRNFEIIAIGGESMKNKWAGLIFNKKEELLKENSNRNKSIITVRELEMKIFGKNVSNSKDSHELTKSRKDESSASNTQISQDVSSLDDTGSDLWTI